MESGNHLGMIDVPLYASFNLCAPRPIAVLTTMHHLGEAVRNEYFERMPGFSYDPNFDYDAAPMSTTSALTLQGKRPRGHTGQFEKGGAPVHLVSITSTRKTYRNFLETGEAVANFLFPRQRDVEGMYVLSDGRYNSGNPKIKDSSFTLEDSRVVGVPRIREAMSWIEYVLIREIPVPESERPILLLQPVAAYALEGLIDPVTFAYSTDVVPIGQLSANICSGRLAEILFAKEQTGGRKFTPQSIGRIPMD